MSIAEKIAALVEALKREGFETMRPADRRRLAELCRFIADKAEPRTEPPKAGVLYDLRRGHRDE